MMNQCTFWEKHLNDACGVLKMLCFTSLVPGSLLVPRAVAVVVMQVQTEFHHCLASSVSPLL